jgi:hypothetical protein
LYLPVFGIGVLGITGNTVFEKVGIFAIPSDRLVTDLNFVARVIAELKILVLILYILLYFKKVSISIF